MTESGGRSPSYTEALDTVHRDLAVLQTQLGHQNERIGELADSIRLLCAEHDSDHEDIGRLKTRAAVIEDRQSRSNWILGILQALTMGVLGWFGVRS